MSNNLTAKIVDLWYSKSRISLFLLPITWFYQLIISIRCKLYYWELLSSTKFNLPVIVVGNITTGGTGKTPLVIYLAEVLKQHGFKPGIVSRGYKGQAVSYPYLVSCYPSKDPDYTQHACVVGDEPLLIARRTECPVVVDPKRVKAVQYLLAETDCDVVISDDGLQHYALRRDIEIAVIDGVWRLGNGLCLPAGPLREPMRRLKEVDFVVCNGEPLIGEVAMRLVAGQVYNLKTHKTLTQSLTKVHAVAAIGNPQRFFSSLRSLGYNVVEHVFPDHHAFISQDLQFADNLPVIMTEKDAVKCQEFAKDNYWVLPVSAELNQGFVEQLIGRLR